MILAWFEYVFKYVLGALRRSYADAVLVEDVNELEEASEEGIAPLAVLLPPPVPLFEEPLVRTGKRIRTKPKSWNVGHKNVRKYEYGHNHLQTDLKMRPMPHPLS